jgi:DNA polymerase-1
MRRILFDLEGNGFLDAITKVHCIAAVDVDTEERRVFGPAECNDVCGAALEYLATADVLIAHNGIGYDFPALEKVCGFVVPFEKQLDTLVIARLIHPNVKENDSKFNATLLQQKKPTMGAEFGKHTLRAWGLRLGLHKADYEGPWDVWSQSMQDYCVQDIETTLRLWRFLKADEYSQDAIVLEHRTARLCKLMTAAGWPFDEKKAGELHADLIAKKADCEKRLIEEFKGWEHTETFVPKVNIKARGYVKGEPFTKKKWVAFNPGSRQHIERALRERGWEPTEFTPSGQAKLDEEVIENLAAEFAQANTLVEFLMLDKRLGQLADGKQAWFKQVKNGKIHAEYNPMGAVTSRASHFNPNIAQVPSSSSLYGHECRELFTVPEGWVLVGADMAGLEGRCLAHYLAKYDGGAYGEVLLRGDPHWAVVRAAGFLDCARDKKNPLHDIIRNGAKRVFYAMLYGAGAQKIGLIILETCRAARKANPEWGFVYADFFKTEAPGKKTLQNVGSAVKRAVIEGIDGFSQLARAILHALHKRPTLKGLDKRRLPIRSEHAALNTLLQSAGAILCKRWICDAYDALIAAGFRWGWDGGDFVFLGWIHDELQVACRNGLGDRIGEVLTSAAKGAGEPYGFRIELDSEYKIGRTWADTH